MQSEPFSSLGWQQLLLLWLANNLGVSAITTVVNLWLQRRQRMSVEENTDAQTAEIHVRARVTEGDAIVRYIQQIGAAQDTIDRLRSERDAWQDEYDKVFVERDQLTLINGKLRDEVKVYEEQVKRMHATLTSHGLNYDDTRC